MKNQITLMNKFLNLELQTNERMNGQSQICRTLPLAKVSEK